MTTRAPSFWDEKKVAQLAADWPRMANSELAAKWGRHSQNLANVLRRHIGRLPAKDANIRREIKREALRLRWDRLRPAKMRGDGISSDVASRLLGVARGTVYRLMDGGHLACFRRRVRGRTLYTTTRAALLEFVREYGRMVELYPADDQLSAAYAQAQARRDVVCAADVAAERGYSLVHVQHQLVPIPHYFCYRNTRWFRRADLEAAGIL